MKVQGGTEALLGRESGGPEAADTALGRTDRKDKTILFLTFKSHQHTSQMSGESGILQCSRIFLVPVSLLGSHALTAQCPAPHPIYIKSIRPDLLQCILKT